MGRGDDWDGRLMYGAPPAPPMVPIEPLDDDELSELRDVLSPPELAPPPDIQLHDGPNPFVIVKVDAATRDAIRKGARYRFEPVPTEAVDPPPAYALTSEADAFGACLKELGKLEPTARARVLRCLVTWWGATG